MVSTDSKTRHSGPLHSPDVCGPVEVGEDVGAAVGATLAETAETVLPFGSKQTAKPLETPQVVPTGHQPIQSPISQHR